MTEPRPTSAELRTRIVRDQVIPMAKHLFEHEPRAQSVMFLVGQFWSDEADDAVHGEFLACLDRDPTWPDCARFAANPLGNHKQAGEYDPELGEVPTDDAFSAQYELIMEAPNRPYLDDNGEMIVAFAAYCLEGCDQDQPLNESFTPYCIVRRDDAEPEIVGKLIRPEWENRWDVIDAAEALALESAASRSPSANEQPAPRSTGALSALIPVGALAYILWRILCS